MRRFGLYCGNMECLSRQTDPPTMFDVADDELVDGEAYLCNACRKAAALTQIGRAT